MEWGPIFCWYGFYFMLFPTINFSFCKNFNSSSELFVEHASSATHHKGFCPLFVLLSARVVLRDLQGFGTKTEDDPMFCYLWMFHEFFSIFFKKWFSCQNMYVFSETTRSCNVSSFLKYMVFWRHGGGPGANCFFIFAGRFLNMDAFSATPFPFWG